MYILLYYFVSKFFTFSFKDKLYFSIVAVMYILTLKIFVNEYLRRFNNISFIIAKIGASLFIRYFIFYIWQQQDFWLSISVIFINVIYKKMTTNLYYGPENFTQTSLRNLRNSYLENPFKLLAVKNKTKVLKFLITNNHLQ
jgi:branched-subunit amino acid ABC-type transport system permease component